MSHKKQQQKKYGGAPVHVGVKNHNQPLIAEIYKYLRLPLKHI